MKPKAYKGSANHRFGTLILAVIHIAVSSALYANGIKDQGEQQSGAVAEKADPRQALKTMLSDPADRPKWADEVPQSDTDLYFVGTSNPYDTATNARDASREDARIQVLYYYGQLIESRAIARSSLSGNTRDTLETYINREAEINSYAQNVVSEVGTTNYYTEAWLNYDNKECYVVYTLCRISRQKAEDDIANFAQNISGRYVNLLTNETTVKTMMRTYAMVIKSLEQNPLHRIIAYYETPSGKAALYEYLFIRINELANSVTIEPIPTRSIQETETLTTLIKIKSNIMPSGLLDCQAGIFGADIPNNRFSFVTSSDDPFAMENKTSKSGSYTVAIEILLSELTSGLIKNISSSYSFVVTPLNEILNSPETVEGGIKRAVDALALSLQPQTDTVIGPFTMTGTDIPSELSIYLTEKVTHYAKNNQGRKYRIVENAEQAAVFSGFFTKRNDRVDITFELSTPDKDRDGSQIFSIAADTLEKTIGVAIEPENKNEMIVLDEVVPPPQTETINIEARLNSSTRTYKHADELVLTINADKDCYFKIIHIDADNQIKMIFPTRNDANNNLTANVSRNVFDTTNSRYVFYGYGAETLVVVASLTQFSNIENEYNQPWKPASETAIQTAIAGAGQARYPITLIKPHEEYEYHKPDNVTEIYQSIRDEASQKGGYFKGNASSGFYIIDNVRGSYIVIGEKVQFASYNLDAYTAENYRGSVKRGSPFTFSFTKPQNINQAVQNVRNSIQESGGTFSGNEQQGNFKASGITGQYKVADMVDVSITEKPVIIPNSLIKKEIENYFGVR